MNDNVTSSVCAPGSQNRVQMTQLRPRTAAGGQTPPLPGLGLLPVEWGEELPPPGVGQVLTELRQSLRVTPLLC